MTEGGFPLEILAELSPALVGEVAESGLAEDREAAEAWLEALRVHGSAEVQRDLRRNHRWPTGTVVTSELTAPPPESTPASAGHGQLQASGPAPAGPDPSGAGGAPGSAALDVELAERARLAQQFFLDVVRRDDEQGPLYELRIIRGRPDDPPAQVMYARYYAVRERSPEEVSLLAHERQRLDALREIDRIMHEP